MITVICFNPVVDKVYYIDDFIAGNMFRPESMSQFAGGKGVNVARVASQLGSRVNLLGFKAGQAGAWLEGAIKSTVVNTCFIEVDGETRTNINIIDRKNNLETEIKEQGPEIRNTDMEGFIKEFKRILAYTSVIVCSGGLAKGMNPDAYYSIIQLAKEHNITTVLDSSKEALLQGIKAKPDYIKPNIKELSEYCGREIHNNKEILLAAKEIISSGVQGVLVTKDKNGAVYVDKECSFEIKIPEISVVNTIGSGDAAVAGLAVGIERELDIVDSLSLAIGCGMANTQFSEVGYVTKKAVEYYKPYCSLKQI